MGSLDLQWIEKATGGIAVSKVKDSFTGVGTDSRADLTGKLFIALKGEAFDAHSFVKGAVEKGAAGLLVHELTPDIEALKSRVSIIKVADTLKALQAMGRQARRDSKVQVVALTGSNGKTTTKEFIAAVIAPFKPTHASKGSFNNHWGVPFTLLDIKPGTEIAVVEMGMNHAGEITELVHIAEPDVVMCTMVGRAHIEHFGSVEKIAAAKEEIYVAAKPEATRIYNLDNEQTRKMFDRARAAYPKAKILTFSAAEKADVQLKLGTVTMRDLEVSGTIAGEAGTAKIAVFGSHNLTNLMAAAAAGLAAGLAPKQIWEGLTHCKTAWGRNQFVKLKSGAEMIFDGYNANPDSMAALLDNMKLISASGRKVGVFGQMRELGEQSPVYHEELGRKAGNSGFDEIFFVGSDRAAFEKGLKGSAFKGALHLGNDYSDELGAALAKGLSRGDIVLVKGSRGMALERFVTPCEPLDFGTK